MKKKVCIDARMLQSGGIGTYLKNLLPYMEAHFDLHLIKDPISIYSIKEQFKLPRLIPECDLFWSPHFNIPLLPIAAKKRLVTIHDLYHLAHFSTLSLKEKIYSKAVMEAAVRFSDHVITVSQFSFDELKRYTGVDPKRVTPIHSGVDFNHFRPDQVPKEKWILFVGNVKPHKNLKGLIQAFSLLQDYKLLIIGKRSGFIHGENLEKEVQDLGDRLIFLENISDEELPSFYKKASLLVFPSFYEGFGLPVLEAMSSGLPVVASNLASIPEIGGDCVHYINPYDPVDIARGIREALGPETFIQKGIERARSFCWKRSAEKHIEVMESLL